ncbi:MAG: RNA pyrophosphohydrolase [Chlamydiia bacterium]|nr:RNA pyrophosphohydrolase [Chlamydiia bacterium]
MDVIQDHSYGIIPVLKDDAGYKLFIIRHCNGNFWGFPKGHIEDGEDAITAAKRELLEETNLEVVSFLRKEPFIEKYKFQKDKILVHKSVDFYLALTTKDAKIDTKELFEGKWIGFEDAENLATYDEGKALCKQVAIYINNHVIDNA